jgi:hypothetical protein
MMLFSVNLSYRRLLTTRENIVFKGFETSCFAGSLQRIAFLLILSLCISVAGAKDFSLSELPQAVRVTIGPIAPIEWAGECGSRK